MSFSMKPQTHAAGNSEGGNSTSEASWDEWNDYFYGLLDSKEQKAKNKDGDVVEGRFYKKKKLVGELALLVDCGFQPQQDASYEWKGVAGKGDQLSDEEQAHVDKFSDNYFQDVDGKRMQFKPERPAQEFAFYFDFPKVMVDWTKHPVEALHRLGTAPLRVGYNGYFKNTAKGIEGFAKNLRFTPNWKTGKISPNNPIYKIATAMGVDEEFSKEYEFGVLAGGHCFFEVFLTKNTYNDKTFYGSEIKNYSEITEIEAGDNVITVEQQIPETLVSFVGVTLSGMEYSPEVLEMISHKKELMAVLPKATSFQPNAVKAPDFYIGCKWEDTDLCKALGDSAPNPVTKQESKPAEKKPAPPKAQPKTQVVDNSEEEDGLDIPF